MLRIMLMAGATLVFVGAFASTGSAKAIDSSAKADVVTFSTLSPSTGSATSIDPFATSTGDVVTFGTASDTQPLVIAVENGTSRTHPQPRRPRSSRTRGPK